MERSDEDVIRGAEGELDEREELIESADVLWLRWILIQCAKSIRSTQTSLVRFDAQVSFSYLQAPVIVLSLW